MSLDDYTIIGPLCYQGKENCENVTCTRLHYPDGTWDTTCRGYHCSYCDAPCSMMGCRCDASEAILGEARRIASEAANRETGE